MLINFCKEGVPYSDYDIEEMVLAMFKEYGDTEYVWNVSSINVIHMARCLYVEKKISDLHILFEGKELQISKNGSFDSWPKIFVQDTGITVRILEATISSINKKMDNSNWDSVYSALDNWQNYKADSKEVAEDIMVGGSTSDEDIKAGWLDSDK